MSEEINNQEQGEAKESEKIEIAESAEVAGNTQDSKEYMTVEDARKSGWSEEEIKMGEQHGVFKKEAKKSEKTKEVIEDKKDVVPQKEEEQKEIQKKPVKDGEEFFLDADSEKKFREFFPKGHNVHGLYFHSKAQRSRAQAAEAERDRIAKQLEEKEAQLKKLMESRENKIESEINIEDEEKPLTKKELKEFLLSMRDNQKKEEQENQRKISDYQSKLQNSLKLQDDNARLQYEDYDDVVSLGKQLIERDSSGKFLSETNITNIPDFAKKKAIALIRSIENSLAQADKFGADDYNIADMSYDLGKIAQQFIQKSNPSGQRAEKNGLESERSNGGLTPEEVKRIEKNSSRRGSSASLSGAGGRRLVSVEDITADDLLKMDSKTFDSFQRKHPEKVEELMRR